MKMDAKQSAWWMLCLSVLVAGCSEQPDETPATESQIDGSSYLLDEAPEGAADVIAVRETAEDDDEVVIVGRIGGSRNPWIEGRAAFNIVDGSLKACSDIPGDNCRYPWDYCCETARLPDAIAFIEFVDEDGRTIEADARELLNVKELSEVVVKGKAQRDEAGNLTVQASGIYIKPPRDE